MDLSDLSKPSGEQQPPIDLSDLSKPSGEQPSGEQEQTPVEAPVDLSEPSGEQVVLPIPLPIPNLDSYGLLDGKFLIKY